MASRNFHKRRTKERKARQLARRHLDEAKRLRRRSLTGLHRHQEIMAAAATAQMGVALQTLGKLPKFVRGRKPDYYA